MDRLSILLTLMTGAVITGVLVIAAFTVGLYTWWGIATAAIIGWVLAWPAAYLISRRVKRDDPGWDETRTARRDSGLPDPDAPEV